MPQSSDYSRPLYFLGSTRKDLRAFPKSVRDDIGFDLFTVQRGLVPDSAKPIRRFPGVMEIRQSYATDAWRQNKED